MTGVTSPGALWSYPWLSPWKTGMDPSNLPSRELVAKAAAAGREEVEENNRKNLGRKQVCKGKPTQPYPEGKDLLWKAQANSKLCQSQRPKLPGLTDFCFLIQPPPAEV